MARRQLPEINAGSMADIAFLLLIFFLVTTTMDVDSGLQRMLPPLPEDAPEIVDFNKRNVFVVLVNANNQLFVKGEPGDIKSLRREAKEFIANPGRKENLPEKEEKEVPFFGNYAVSKQVISLQNDRGTSYETYIMVQNELAAAYNELRNEIAMSQFGKSYDDLVLLKDEERVAAVRMIYPQRISEAEPKNIGGK
ncbi:MAG: biopolymer transporter ExbD [Bacteroidetes bacterium]|nr:biopolymer transporter ExbD [Bacteroidota bacterium]HET6243757.1 biopolymer transporter ExbD [Bacteroidia bacterium]